MSATRIAPVRRVALIGAESTGKTTLAASLGVALDAEVVSEYLREFCSISERTPRRDEQAGIAATQREREHAAVERARRRGTEWVVCDTTPLMIALYSLECFGDASLLDAALDWQRGYDATLLCQPDIDWVADGIQRVGPETRDRIHAALVAILEAAGIRWQPVEGRGPARLTRALDALQSLR